MESDVNDEGQGDRLDNQDDTSTYDHRCPQLRDHAVS